MPAKRTPPLGYDISFEPGSLSEQSLDRLIQTLNSIPCKSRSGTPRGPFWLGAPRIDEADLVQRLEACCGEGERLLIERVTLDIDVQMPPVPRRQRR